MNSKTTLAIDDLAGILDCSYTKGDNVKAYLEESDPSAITKKIIVEGLQTGDLVVRIDEGRKKKCPKCDRPYSHVTSLLRQDSTVHAHRLTDAVLLRLRDDGKYDCLYIDLKSGAPSGFKYQFQSTVCAMRYILDVFKTLHGKHLEVVREKYIIVQAPLKGANFVKLTSKRDYNKKSTPDDPIRIFRNTGGTVLMSEFLAR